MELYLTAIGLLGIASAFLLWLFTLIEIHHTTKASLQGIQALIQMSQDGRQGLQELIRMSQEERGRSEATLKTAEATLKMAEATLRELLEMRQQTPQVH